MRSEKPMWKLIKECAERLTQEGLSPFTRRDLIDCVRSQHPRYEANSLNPIIQGITDNLQGGAPGAVGKDLLHSVGRGQFVLIDGHGPSPEGENSAPAATTRTNAPRERSFGAQELPPVNWDELETEDDLRDVLMAWLFAQVGAPGTWAGNGQTASFQLGEKWRGWSCAAERKLTYDLPNGASLEHKSDVLLVSSDRDRFVSIELKYKSAVTDQFKCRAYDVLHLKRQYGNRLFGVMVFVKTTSGISINRAKSICYPFDYFLGVPQRTFREGLTPLVTAMQGFMASQEQEA